MSLREQGFSFCISPDKTEGRWIHPAERIAYYSDWTDVTDWPSEELVEFLMGPAQQSLFAA